MTKKKKRVTVTFNSSALIRIAERFGVPAEAVHYRKRRKIVKTAQCWLQQYEENDRPCRFDVIEILKTKPSYDIRHITHAFIMEC